MSSLQWARVLVVEVEEFLSLNLQAVFLDLAARSPVQLLNLPTLY
jgi:hypothetical protein